MFELFFTEDVVSLLVTENHNILILPGYGFLPGKDYYWDTPNDMDNTLLKNLCDETNSEVCTSIYTYFIEHFLPEEDMNYDESVVKCYRWHSCKQFIKGKPIRLGYKIWSVNTKSGYLQGIQQSPNEAMFGCKTKVRLSTLNLPREVVDNLVAEEDLENVEQKMEDAINAGISFRNKAPDVVVDNSNAKKFCVVREKKCSLAHSCGYMQCKEKIGDNVRIRIPDVDRDRGDRRSALAVVTNIEGAFCKLGTEQLFSRSEFSILHEKLLTLESVGTETKSLRPVVAPSQSLIGGGQSYT
ncbi:hypothetical protein ILUMI_20191 [Ignelater luminosus]|uniref:PiggyBac transposable element-derived protein domain-containing protein n=1 Tax=Ignelater luminosus TaxID=2038154 RepID=A0A8K0CL30_IGNLU|nr:hypothetical protein ILUMI_20191 [Ignelater luminosus]